MLENEQMTRKKKTISKVIDARPEPTGVIKPGKVAHAGELANAEKTTSLVTLNGEEALKAEIAHLCEQLAQSKRETIQAQIESAELVKQLNQQRLATIQQAINARQKEGGYFEENARSLKKSLGLDATAKLSPTIEGLGQDGQTDPKAYYALKLE